MRWRPRIAQEPLVAPGPHPVQLRARGAGAKAGADRRCQQPAGLHPQSVRREARAQRCRTDGAAFKSTAAKLRAAAGNGAGQAGAAMPAAWPMRWTRVAKAGPPAIAPRHAKRLVPGLKTMLRPGVGFAEGRAGHARHHAGRHARGLGRRRRHRPHPGLSQGHQQRSRRAVGLHRSGAERGAAGHRRADLHPRIRQDHRGRLRRSRHPVLHRHHHPAGAGAAQRCTMC